MAKHNHHAVAAAKAVDVACGMAIPSKDAAGTIGHKNDTSTAQKGRAVNLVPLPYSRVAVQDVDFELNETELKAFLRGKEAWFETDYVVFRRSNDCGVVELRKENRQEMFSKIRDVRIVSLPDTSHWIEDCTVDTGNPSSLAEKARALGITASETLVVSGLYEHVNFIHRPQPTVIDVFDLSPPDPPRLVDMARRVIASRNFPAIVLNPRIESIPAMVPHLNEKPILFPCGISQLKRMVTAVYLDERPDRQDWLLVGCERSRQIHRHVYGDEPSRIELCPKKLFVAGDAPALMRCCMVKGSFELRGNVAVVPWGADLPVVEEAIRALLNSRINTSINENTQQERNGAPVQSAG